MNGLQDLGFAAAYTCRIISESPGSETIRMVSGRSSSTGESLFVEVRPQDGAPWIGRFQCGAYPFTGLFACPNEDYLCVVAGGFGYWVDVAHPGRYETLRVKPVRGVERVPGLRILVCWDFQDLAAYGVEGVQWWIEHLSEDDLEITAVDGDKIVGSAWNPIDDTRPIVCVDPHTGRATGGYGRIRWHPSTPE